jgi:glycine oxidase
VQLEPELGHFDTSLFLPDEGQIDNRMLLLSLQKQLERQKVKWLRGQTIDAVNGGSFEINSQSYEYDLIIDCRGTGARAQMSDLRGVRGELFRLYAPQVKLNRPVRLMHPRYQLYIAPKPGSYYVVGATEIESDDDSPVTVRSALELLSAAYSVHPGFAEASIVEQISCCRPAFANNHPQIRVSNQLIQVNGLYRHGFMVAPVVLEHLLGVIERLPQAPEKQDDHYLAHFREGMGFEQLIQSLYRNE